MNKNLLFIILVKNLITKPSTKFASLLQRQRRAASESKIADLRHRVRDRHRRQRRAASEGIVADVRHRVWDRNRR